MGSLCSPQGAPSPDSEFGQGLTAPGWLEMEHQGHWVGWVRSPQGRLVRCIVCAIKALVLCVFGLPTSLSISVFLPMFDGSAEPRWHQQQRSSAWSLARWHSLKWDELWIFTSTVELIYPWFIHLSAYMHNFNIVLRHTLNWVRVSASKPSMRSMSVS